MIIGKDANSIIEVITTAFNIHRNHMCILEHDDKGFKVYVDDIDERSMKLNTIYNAWNISEKNLSIDKSPAIWWKLCSDGYIVRVTY